MPFSLRPSLRDTISAPLEAGTSLLTSQHLPQRLTNALEYISDRLCRKQLHLTLIVVRKDLQNDQPPISPPASSYLFSRNGAPSPALSVMSSSSVTTTCSSTSSLSTHSFSKTHWSSLPSSPKAFKFQQEQPLSEPLPNPYNLTLLHAASLTKRAERILRETIAKASKKFYIGSGWLPTEPMTSEVNNDLIRRSLKQNDVLFSSEGLTLLSLDHVYQFKTLLSRYSRIASYTTICYSAEKDAALQDATDALRRLVLLHSGRRISKGYLQRVYPYLNVTHASIITVNCNYQICYGGDEMRSGIATTDPRNGSPLPTKTSFDAKETARPKSAEGQKKAEVPTLQSKLSGLPLLKTESQEPRVGPVTPNAFEDITPVTRGEWCFLMVGDGWKGNTGRTEIITCA